MKRALPDSTHTVIRSNCAEFPTRHPWLDRKPAGIHARRPTVWIARWQLKISDKGNGNGNRNRNRNRSEMLPGLWL